MRSRELTALLVQDKRAAVVHFSLAKLDFLAAHNPHSLAVDVSAVLDLARSQSEPALICAALRVLQTLSLSASVHVGLTMQSATADSKAAPRAVDGARMKQEPAQTAVLSVASALESNALSQRAWQEALEVLQSLIVHPVLRINALALHTLLNLCASAEVGDTDLLAATAASVSQAVSMRALECRVEQLPDLSHLLRGAVRIFKLAAASARTSSNALKRESRTLERPLSALLHSLFSTANRLMSSKPTIAEQLVKAAARCVAWMPASGAPHTNECVACGCIAMLICICVRRLQSWLSSSSSSANLLRYALAALLRIHQGLHSSPGARHDSILCRHL